MSRRLIYLVVYRNSLFPAHWALWIPSFDAETQTPGNIGKIINVEGDPSTGFRHEFVRNYDMSAIQQTKTIISLGWTDSENVIDGSNAGDIVYDSIATDEIESWALRIAAPGPSLRSVTSTVGRFPHSVDFRNLADIRPFSGCQDKGDFAKLSDMVAPVD